VFINEYIIQNAEGLTEYIYTAFFVMNQFFMHETAPKPRQFSLIPLITIIDLYDTRDLLSSKAPKNP